MQIYEYSLILFSNVTHFIYFADDPSKSAETLCSIPARSLTRPSYYHSFGMTDNYFVFLEQTLYCNVSKLAMSAILKIPVCHCLEYEPEDESFFHVIEKKTGKITTIKYRTVALFGMHVVNSYEEDGHIVFDLCCYDDDSILNKFYLEYLRNGDKTGSRSFPRPELRRFVLPLNVNEVRKLGTIQACFLGFSLAYTVGASYW